MADPVRGSLGVPFPEQVAALRLRLGDLVPTSRWDDIQRSAHDSSFMVAGALKTDLLTDIFAAIDSANVSGGGLEAFRRDWKSIVEKRGWHGWTGEGTAKGEAWRTRVVFQTNMSVSRAAGRLAQLRDGNFPIWVYLHGGSREPRVHHLALDGIALPSDHPFWLKWYAPNGWGCSCRIRGARSAAGVRRLGGDPDKKLPEFWDRIDPKTGAPVGIDKGWDYMPGGTVSQTINEMTRKAVNWEYSLATAYMRQVPAAHVDAFSTGYRDLPSMRTELRRWVERVQGARNGAPIDPKVVVEPQKTLGLATAPQRAEIERLTGADLGEALYDFAVDRNAVRHVFDRHGNAATERSRGQRAVTPEDLGRLGELLNAPDSVSLGDVRPGQLQVIRYEKQVGTDRLVALFELRPGRRRLSLVTMWVEVPARPRP
ncbi:PBECR3 domain-containing polyvalent protein [Frigidibacter oleivorans]|uniref:PBECR3 domain-containing polyvalent protein n=1 Tax=Frigidibacter oleivorans TaxID=2487129 RepID=UPI000F8C330D|nr:phage minor head protein [Frigidibacter oleivorans]